MFLTLKLILNPQQSYEFYDGFLILHGTDTLSYTASALSFMLENLGKTVIITGSQIPIYETRTDGKDNFTSGLILAGNYVIPGKNFDAIVIFLIYEPHKSKSIEFWCILFAISVFICFQFLFYCLPLQRYV